MRHYLLDSPILTGYLKAIVFSSIHLYTVDVLSMKYQKHL